MYGLLRAEFLPWEWFLEKLKMIPRLEEVVDVEKIDPDKGMLAVALCINPAFEPLRIVFSVATIRPLMRLLGRRGK